MFTPDQQRALDDAYWNTTRTITDVRTEFGLTVGQLNKQITPLLTGTSCWWCRSPLAFANRRARSDRWQRLTCSCGADQPHISERTDLRPTDAAIIAPRFERRGPWGPYSGSVRGGSPERASISSASTVVCLAVEALERAGLRWNGQFQVVEASDAPAEVIGRLERLPTRVLVVPSITDTMANEGDALALFFRLVARGWRVMSASDSRLGRGVYDGWCDDLAHLWQRDVPERSLRLVPG